MSGDTHVYCLRHAESKYQAKSEKKKRDLLYRRFKREFDIDPTSCMAYELAMAVWKKYGGNDEVSIPLSARGREQAIYYGSRLYQHMPKPQAIIISTHDRTVETFECMRLGGLDIDGVDIIYTDQIREQEHGLQSMYGDWRVLQVLHPDEKDLRDRVGRYYYRFPEGESVEMVKDRAGPYVDGKAREYAGKVMLLVTHQLTKLALRTHFEQLSVFEFMDLQENDKPLNCGMMHHRRAAGADRFELVRYNHLCE